MFVGRDVVFGVQARQEVKIVISKISKISRRRTLVCLQVVMYCLIISSMFNYNIHLLVKLLIMFSTCDMGI